MLGDWSEMTAAAVACFAVACAGSPAPLATAVDVERQPCPGSGGQRDLDVLGTVKLVRVEPAYSHIFDGIRLP
ncbi:MAG: hypothetical protein ABSC94_25070 [Polyangiaceae bacterium]|jgi:hypothetical protein